eukprot:5497833-Alexandrium_andersonii.AAC.1
MLARAHACSTTQMRALSPVCMAGPSWCMQYGRKHGRTKSMYARERAGTGTLTEYGRSGSTYARERAGTSSLNWA